MLKSTVGAACAQELFDAAANAGAKGNAQFLTPEKFGRRICGLLAPVRHVILDPTAGDGALLRAARTRSSRLLALEVDPAAAGRITDTDGSRNASVMNGDLTALYPLLAEVGFTCDTAVCNPPWDLHWFKDRLAALEMSDVAAVAEAFAEHDGRTAHGTIDSTIATLCVALDRLKPHGEGLLIANENTLQRLLLGPDAPHRALVRHCWAHAVFPGSVFAQAGTDGITCNVGVLWFARGHRTGPGEITDRILAPEPDYRDMRLHRTGAETRAYHEDDALDSLAHWDTVRQEALERAAEAAGQRRPWHLFLAPDGTIGTRLNRYEGRTVEGNRLRRLHELNGKTPLQLVIQKTERRLLLDVTQREGWRVEPALAAAVENAVVEYHRVRAPLTPLNDVQRLGYLDEEDTIVCKRDLLLGPVLYSAGQRYPLRTQTVPVTRKDTKFDFAGQPVPVELTGQHLAIYIGTAPGLPVPGAETNGHELCFMDASLLSEDHTIGNDAQVDATLHQLIEHFTIPEVPDVAVINPAGYRQHLGFMATLEQLLQAA